MDWNRAWRKGLARSRIILRSTGRGGTRLACVIRPWGAQFRAINIVKAVTNKFRVEHRSSPGKPPTFTRRLLLTVMWLNVVVYITAAVVAVITFDPDRLYFVRRNYQPGHHILFANVCLCAFGLVQTSIFLFGFHRSDAAEIAAMYAFLNAIVVQYPILGTIRRYYGGLEPNFAVGAFWAAWLLMTAAFATTYWAQKRRYDAGGRPTRPAIVAIAEALNTPVDR